jgi:hypothetical protein
MALDALLFRLDLEALSQALSPLHATHEGTMTGGLGGERAGDAA